MPSVAGLEEMPPAVSHRDHGRIVYVYEPILANFVRIIFSTFLNRCHFIDHFVCLQIHERNECQHSVARIQFSVVLHCRLQWNWSVVFLCDFCHP